MNVKDFGTELDSIPTATPAQHAAGNYERANALLCLIVWMRGGDYIVPGVRHG